MLAFRRSTIEKKNENIERWTTRPDRTKGLLAGHGQCKFLCTKVVHFYFFEFSYFGLKYYGQCWSGENAGQAYSRDGPAASCVRGVGVESTYFVYKFHDYSEHGKASLVLMRGGVGYEGHSLTYGTIIQLMRYCLMYCIR